MKVEVNNAQQNEQVDWTKNPQLVCCGDNIVLVHTNQNLAMSNEEFVGTRIGQDYTSDYSIGWIKSAFKPFHGTITLQND